MRSKTPRNQRDEPASQRDEPASQQNDGDERARKNLNEELNEDLNDVYRGRNRV
jgi:hypothetical protein